jgi:dTDP-glucose pyrophosphorylase
MSGFLGILFCGGRGRRLGEITDYISKAFVPVFDRPVFQYPLEQLNAASHVDEILILTNEENDRRLRRTGYATLQQDDNRVHDMFSGLAFIRETTGDGRPAVLIPCDNLSEIQVDDVIALLLEREADMAINIRRIDDPQKLRQMGVFDPRTATMLYRPDIPPTDWGVVAPYVVAADLELSGSMPELVARYRTVWREYRGMWFDVGDPFQLAAANAWCLEQR